MNPPEDPAQEAERLAGSMLEDAYALAREDPCAFMALALEDEQTGGEIDMAPMHEEWQDLISLHRALVITSHYEAGKTVGVSIGRVLWEVGRNPNLHVAVVSSTAGRAENIIRALGQHIERNPVLRRVFPALKPSGDPSLQWTADALTVERQAISKDPTIKAYGVEALVPGPRLDFVVLDDILTMENTRTQGQRDTLWTRLTSTLFTRMTAGSRIVCIGNAWHPDDAMHRMRDLAKFHAVSFPIVDARGEITWPKRWTRERIEEQRVILGAFEFARMMMCVARDDATSRIRREWVDRCLKRGLGLELTYAYERPPAGRVYTGMDLAVSKSSSADKSAIFTMLARADGAREVVNVETGRWSAREILARLRSVLRRYGGVALVENVAAQDYIVQLAQEPGAQGEGTPPVYPFTTTRQKHDPAVGVESIAAELEAARWIIPARQVGDTLVGATPEINEWIADLLAYDPNGHTGDALMASYFAREAARRDDVAWQPPRATTPRHASELTALLEDPDKKHRPRQLTELDMSQAAMRARRQALRDERSRIRDLRAELQRRGIDPDKLG